MPSTSGLSHEEAKRKLLEWGLNEIAPFEGRKPEAIFFSQFKNVLVILLLVSAFISFLLADWTDGIFILLIVILNSILGFIQEYRAEKALAALRKIAVSKTTVIRDGKEKEIDSRFLAPGDVIKIEEGDKIPADAKLLETVHLEVNEASLTGESLPIFKKAHEKDHDTIFLGTIVLQGRAKAVIEQTGIRTRFGTIAKKLSEIEPEPTPLQRQLASLGKQLGAVAVLASMLVFFFGVFRGQEIVALFLTSISLTVAAVPEGLPAVITITLAIGVHRMARQRAIVRKMAAIETLGAATIIATDKTGTITKNEMRVRELFVDGKNFQIRSSKFEVRNSAVEELLRIGVLANTASLVFRHDGESFDLIGDPTEGALLLAAHELGFSPGDIRKEGELIDEFSFDVERKTMAVLWKDLPVRLDSAKRAGRQGSGETFAYVKGAPASVLEKSTKILLHEKEQEFTEILRKELEEATGEAASRGYRVIAMAKKQWLGQGNVTRDKVESDLVFVGFAALSDPPREEVKDAAKEAANAGIRTIIITGDNELTANAIATEVGLITQGEDILTGEQLDTLSDDELLQILPNIRIFARTTPVHKLRIVKTYQRNGDIVAVTGDGVNDALALRQANVGVAMGITGTDVAKEASDLVVSDDNYATIVRAIEEGRVVFDNILKSVVYLASGNLGEILTILGAVIIDAIVPFGLPVPLVPVQILWINLVTDGLPALALASDPKDPYIMQRRPRRLAQSILVGANLRFILLTGSVLAAIVLSLFVFSLTVLSESQARTVAFTTLILLHISIAFIVRGHYRIFSNKFLLFSIFAVVALQLLILTVPSLQVLFKLGPLW